MERRALASEEQAKTLLTENGKREAAEMTLLLERQIKRVRDGMRDAKVPAQLSLGLTTDEEKQQLEKELRQFEADRRSWDGTLLRLQDDLEKQPNKIRDGYEVRARQLEPIGLVYLWPATN